MDYITIGFTIVIVAVMIVFLLKALKPEWFQKKDKGSATPTATQGQPTATDNTPVEQPTETPVYTGIGNAYGNMSNDASAAEIDGRRYFVTGNEAGGFSLCVNDGTGDRTLVSGEARISSVNVIKDPFTYADVAGTVAYKVSFIDGSGKICAVTDGPFPSDAESTLTADDVKVTEKTALAEGTYKSFVSVGAYLYCIDADGYIVRISLNDGSKTALSKNKYTSLAVYYGSIYALSDSGSIYVLTTTARPVSDSAEGGEEQGATDDEYEKLVVTAEFGSISVFDDWIYACGQSGVIRYDAESFGRDTLTTEYKPVAVNVDRRGIFMLVREVSGDGSEQLVLLNATAKDLLGGTPVRIGAVAVSENSEAGGAAAGSYRITLCSDMVYVSSADGGSVYGASYVAEAAAYGELAALTAE